MANSNRALSEEVRFHMLRFVPIAFLLIIAVLPLGTLTAAPSDAPVTQATQTPTATVPQGSMTATTPTATQVVTTTPTTAATASATPAMGTPAPTADTLPDLTITMVQSSDRALVGSVVGYTITISNAVSPGPSTIATGLAIQIPSGTSVAGIDGSSCTLEAARVVCPVAPLTAGATASYAMTVRVNSVVGSISTIARVDEQNLVAEGNEDNNSATATALVVASSTGSAGSLFDVQPALPMPEPAQVPQPEAPAAEVPPPPSAAPVESSTTSAGTPWVRILAPAQASSVDDDPLWVAQPGELYWVMERESGWLLGVWEGDTTAWAVWLRDDTSVQALSLDRPIPLASGQLWLVAFAPVQTYSMSMAPMWLTSPGEWYQVMRRESGWALGRWEGDPPGSTVWIPTERAVEFATMDAPH
jgi:hypothetical protein